MASPYITTIKERCRMCYTCVRECPAKAIRIVDGQAEVIGDRCIACGNCVRVCSQHAKEVRNDVAEVERLLASGQPVAACLAPSFPAEFTDIGYRQLVGMVRELGFQFVQEVAFGADLVAREYYNLLKRPDGKRYILTSCPAICGYVERYYAGYVGLLAPIVSPMIATARAVRKIRGDEVLIVFVGPCIAKKVEAESGAVAGDVDAALTFGELRQMLEARSIRPDTVEPSEFDEPFGSSGGLFPISRGALQAASIQEDLMTGEVVSTQGRSHVLEAIKEFTSGDLGSKFLEVLCCDGCIMGVGVNNDLPLFNRRRRVREYVCERMKSMDHTRWQESVDRLSGLDLSRRFEPNDQRISPPAEAELAEIMARMGKQTPDDELNCGACGYDTCREHAIAIYKGLAESEMCLPYTIDQLSKALKEVETSNTQLASAQEALVQSEKLASMGQLAAGIAHEVNNPLGVVLMYAHLLLEECEQDSPLKGDLKLIADQADRCKKIVAGLLHFARQNKLARFPVDLRRLIKDALRPMTLPDNVTLKVEQYLEDPTMDADRDQIIQVLTNLITNAVAAMEQGGILTIRTEGDAETVRISVADTGIGIPTENLKKIFEPFFTTKQMGRGTGLGLAVTYGVVKMHRGDISVESNADPAAGPTGTTFTVTLPRHE